MGFGWGGVWGMGYGGFMGYAMHFPTNQLGGCKMLWGLRGYGFSEVWVTANYLLIDPLCVCSQVDSAGVQLHFFWLGAQPN